jgi:hypothetical protein
MAIGQFSSTRFVTTVTAAGQHRLQHSTISSKAVCDRLNQCLSTADYRFAPESLHQTETATRHNRFTVGSAITGDPLRQASV